MAGTATGLSPEDERSWRLNEAALVAAACADWNGAVGRIRTNLDRLASERRASPDLIRRYATLVDRGPDVLRAEVLALTDAGRRARHLSSPPAGARRLRHR